MEFAVFESGNGREEVAKFCEVYNMPAMKTPLIKPSKRKEANSYKRTEQAQVSKEVRLINSGRIQQA